MRHLPLHYRVQIQWGVSQSLDLWVQRQNQHRRHCFGSSLVHLSSASLESRCPPWSCSAERGLWRAACNHELTQVLVSWMHAPLVQSVRHCTWLSHKWPTSDRHIFADHACPMTGVSGDYPIQQYPTFPALRVSGPGNRCPFLSKSRSRPSRQPPDNVSSLSHESSSLSQTVSLLSHPFFHVLYNIYISLEAD